MKNILVTGSIAYDHLLTFDGQFKESIIAEQLEHLSVSFTANSHHTDFGGCGANIAFSLNLLGDYPVLFGVVGNDFERYRNWLTEKGVSPDYLVINDNHPTANAYVLTDKNFRQIAIFSPAAMLEHDVKIELTGIDFTRIDLALIAPELPLRMHYFAEYFTDQNIPFIFDPGQSMPAFQPEELLKLLDLSIGVIVNEYEAEMLMKKCGLSLDEIAARAGFLVRTLGEKGCEYFTEAQYDIVPAVSGLDVVDVTGSGDAFRAGFIKAYADKRNFARACALGNVVASFALECEGTQKHTISEDVLETRLKQVLS